VTKYVIESEGRVWVLRRSGQRGTIASGSDAVSVREQAFVRLRQYAPCSFRVLDEIREEWQLESDDGEWSRAVTLASGDQSS
jgi:hypothetical protein